MSPIMEIRHLEKTFGDHQVLKDINFDVEKGNVICIIGSSGSGKSTLLRCLNFLETPTSGQIFFHGKDASAEWKRTEYNSKVGMVFQSFNLFGNMNALDFCIKTKLVVAKINAFHVAVNKKNLLTVYSHHKTLRHHNRTFWKGSGIAFICFFNYYFFHVIFFLQLFQMQLNLL